MFDAFRSAIEARRDAMQKLLALLVDQNSFTDNRDGGTRVGELLAAEIESIPGLSVRTVASHHYAPHLVAATSQAAKSAEGSIALVGHLDTVFPPGTFEGFSVDGPLARGPGVLDMKGGLVVILEALRAIAATAGLERSAIRLVIVSDEEIGSPEGQDVIRQELAGARCALVFEAGRAGDRVITSRKGTGSARVEAKGRAAHAGNAHKDGVNAIWALARFIDRAQALTDPTGSVTVNVGTVQGGTSKNTVPDAASAVLDLRFTSAAEGARLVARLDELAKESAASLSGSALRLDARISRTPLERTEANLALYLAYAIHARQAGLGDGECERLGGGSDASTTAAMGIPTIDGLGPRGSGFHTKEEYIELASLIPKAHALAAFLFSASAGPRS